MRPLILGALAGIGTAASVYGLLVAHAAMGDVLAVAADIRRVLGITGPTTPAPEPLVPPATAALLAGVAVAALVGLALAPLYDRRPS